MDYLVQFRVEKVIIMLKISPNYDYDKDDADEKP